MESRAFEILFDEHEILMVLHILLLIGFHLIEFILNVIKFIEWGVGFENIELKSITCNMRRDKFLTDWYNEQMIDDLILVLKWD